MAFRTQAVDVFLKQLVINIKICLIFMYYHFIIILSLRYNDHIVKVIKCTAKLLQILTEALVVVATGVTLFIFVLHLLVIVINY